MSVRNTAATPSRSNGDPAQAYQSIEDWNEMEIRLQYMQAQVEEAQSALARKHILQQEAEGKAEAAIAETRKMETTTEEQRQEIESLRGLLEAETLVKEELTEELSKTKTELAAQTSRAEKAEERCDNLTEELNAAKEKIQSLEDHLQKEIELKRDALNKLRETSIELKKTKALLEATQTTESLLTAEALALLATLKESITDGDSLYALLEKHRQEVVTLRANTRDYSNAQNNVLDEILQYLISMTNTATNLCKNLEDDAKSNHSQGCDAMDKTYNIFQQMSKDLGELSMAIRNQCVGTDGIVPTMASTTSDLTCGIEKASKTIIAGEEVMITSISVLRERLIEHSSKIEKLWSIHDANANAAISVLESDVETCKANLMKMVESTNDKLKKISKDQDKIRKSQSELITEWEASSLLFSQNIQNTANTEHDELVKSAEEFKSQVTNINETDSTLEQQEKFLIKSGDEHSAELIQQRKALEEYKALQLKDQMSLELMRESFMSNVMKGINTLIDEQMCLLKAESTRHFDSYGEKNNDLIAQNDVMTNAAKDIFNDMKKTNQILKEKSTCIRENDQKATNAMDSAQKALGDINDVSQKHQMTTSSMAQEVGQCVTKLSKLEEENAEIVTNLSNEGGDLTDYLEKNMLNAGAENINVLAISGRDLAHYGEKVLIPEFIASLDGIEAPRPRVMDDFKTLTDQNKERLEIGKQRIIEISEEQCLKTDEIRSYARSKEDNFDKTIFKNQKIELASQRDKLISQTKDYQQSTSTNISNCTKNTSNVKAQMEDFVVDTVKAREDVEPLEDKTKFNFKEEFSSTSDCETIFSTLKFDIEMAIGVEA